MKQTKFKINKMDCPSEENLIRVKLSTFSKIHQLNFDIADRTLVVKHDEDTQQIVERINELNLESKMIEDHELRIKINSNQEPRTKTRNLLITVLIINFAFFLIEIIAGILYNSMGLSADALDMLADAIVYGMSLYAIYKSADAQKRIAKTSGYFQLTLAGLGLLETLRRFLGVAAMPNYVTMIIVSIFALIGNAASLLILNKTKSEEAHIKASMIFTTNDVIINLGVILAGFFVLLTGTKYPDLIAGIIIFTIVINGSRRILSLAK